MPVEGLDYVYVETHNWGKSAAFWKSLGFTLDLDLGTSGKFVSPAGVAVFVEEVPANTPLAFQLYLHAAGETWKPEPPAVAGEWEDSHWGTRLLQVTDPDGRVFVLQAGLED